MTPKSNTFTTLLLLIAICMGCTPSDRTVAENIVKEWAGRQIVLPDVMTDFLSGDTIDLSDADYTILCYIDSVGCTGCKMKLSLWEYILNKIDSTSGYDINFVMIVDSTSVRELKALLESYRFRRNVYHDTAHTINNHNHFPANIAFQTVLMDNDFKVALIGNPTHSQKIEELYTTFLSDGNDSNRLPGLISRDNSIWDIGNIGQGDTITHRFTLTNNCDKPVVISKILPSCECLSVSTPPDTIRPHGGKADIIVSFSEKNDTGEIYRTVDVLFHGFDTSLQLEIFANVSK